VGRGRAVPFPTDFRRQPVGPTDQAGLAGGNVSKRGVAVKLDLNRKALEIGQESDDAVGSLMTGSGFGSQLDGVLVRPTSRHAGRDARHPGKCRPESRRKPHRCADATTRGGPPRGTLDGPR
jgi:hypothetical protein